MADYRNRGGWNDDDDDDGRLSRPSGGVGSSSIAYESGRRRSGRRRLLTLAVVLIAVGGTAAVIWNSYDQNRQSGGEGVVPLIQADNTPTKVRPEQPGGMDVPNQDKLIYDGLTPRQAPPSTVERLLPPPEAPVARPEPTVVPPPVESLLPEAAPRAPVQPSNTLEPPSIATRQPTPLTPGVSAAQPASPTPAPATPSPPPAAVAPSAPAAVAALPPGTAGASGTFRVQLGAVRSQDAAQKEWSRLQKANGDLLGKLGLSVSQANLGDRGTFYRIQAGPIGDQAAASDLCGKLKARNVSCIVVKQ